MVTLIQSILLGFLQGITELFPVSSLGHTVILPSVVSWDINQHDPYFLSFIVATHFATALVLLGFYWEDWLKIITGVLRSLFVEYTFCPKDTHARIGWLLIIATIPAGALGLLFEHKLEELFAKPDTVSIFLFCNGLLLLGAEVLRRRRAHNETHDDERVARLTWGQALMVGLMQCLALFPGFSRTGATIAGGLMNGLSHQDAARFSFLMATPIIFAAALLKLPELVRVASVETLSIIMVGSLCSAWGAYFSVRFLSKYFKTKTLVPFAAYCMIAGMLAFIFIR